MGLIKGKLFNKGNQFLPQALLDGIDVNNLLATSTASSGHLANYTATQDCVACINGSQIYRNSIKVDNISVIGIGSEYNPSYPYFVMPLKKGQTLTFNVPVNHTGYLVAYGLKY